MTAPLSTRRRPEGRYDPPSRTGPRLLAVLLTVLLLALLAAAGDLIRSRYDAEEIRARVVGFSVLSDSSVRIDLVVDKPAGSSAYCLVRSRAEDGREVGRELATVDAAGGPERTVRHRHVLTTTARGVTGEVGRCSAEPIPTSRPAP